jgi:hypothetical protein
MPWGRDTKWRQGRTLSRESFRALDLEEAGDDLTIALAISHDCDIANANTETEPVVEFVLGRIVENRNGNYEHAKNLRILHLQAQVDGADTIVELLASKKIILHKDILANHEPDDGFILEGRCHSVLRDWLTARYKRQAFPDSFNARLAPISNALGKAGKIHAHGILGYWLDYQPRDIELTREDLYELSLFIVYSGDDLAYADHAVAIAEEIKNEFDELKKKSAESGDIELIECAAYSEYEFTLKDMRDNVQFRFEYLSHRLDPPGPVV